MRGMLLLLLAAQLACSVRQDIDLSIGQRAPRAGALLVAYRGQVEAACGSGALTEDECAHQWARLEGLVDAVLTAQPARGAAAALAEAAAALADPEVRARLATLAAAIQQQVR